MSVLGILPTGVLHNQETDRYHPIAFHHSPPPSGDLPNGTGRYRSVGHHTNGFDTKAEADAWIEKTENMSPINSVWEWDGKGSPAMVIWLKCDTSVHFEEACSEKSKSS